MLAVVQRRSPGHVRRTRARRYFGHLIVSDVHPESVTYTLDLLNSPDFFEVSMPAHCVPITRTTLLFFPRTNILIPDTWSWRGFQFINFIYRRRRLEYGKKKYLFAWVDHGEEHDDWFRHLEDCEAFKLNIRGGEGCKPYLVLTFCMRRIDVARAPCCEQNSNVLDYCRTDDEQAPS